MREQPLSIPRVDWAKTDLDDTSSSVSGASILTDYIRPEHGSPRVLRSWIPLHLLREELWEERGEGKYDWAAYRKDDAFPPLKIELFSTERAIEMCPRTSATVVYIRDGNHRIRFWRECGFDFAPAWLIDYRAVRDSGVSM